MTTETISLQVLDALTQRGTSTYADLEEHTGILINKLRWAMNALKQKHHVAQTEDPISNAVAWKITEAGRKALTLALAKAENAEPSKPAQAAPKKTSKPAKTKKALVRATPAEGGANNVGSRASENPVGEATPPTEGAAVPETRADCHGPEALQHAEPVVSDDEAHHGLHINLDCHGRITIGELRFSASETRAIGQFLIDTEPAWN